MGHESIYADPDKRWTSANPAGYRYDVNNPTIRKLWDRYRKLSGISLRYPASDAQRHKFEHEVVDKLVESGKINRR